MWHRRNHQHLHLPPKTRLVIEQPCEWGALFVTERGAHDFGLDTSSLPRVEKSVGETFAGAFAKPWIQTLVTLAGVREPHALRHYVAGETLGVPACRSVVAFTTFVTVSAPCEIDPANDGILIANVVGRAAAAHAKLGWEDKLGMTAGETVHDAQALQADVTGLLHPDTYDSELQALLPRGD